MPHFPWRASGPKLINARGLIDRSQKSGLRRPVRPDLYHGLLTLSWRAFFAVVAIFYLGFNLIFASLYWVTGGGIANADPGSFLDVFFFSVHTFSTVGYGSMYPETLTAHWIAALEIFTGILSVAILTGLMFARFAKPTARVLFSAVAVICPFEGVETLMFRAANRRANRILEAQVRVSLVRDHVTQEGHSIRRFYDLKLLRSQTPVFGLSWLIMHPIDPESPLYGKSAEEWSADNYELWISLTGLDETFSQTIHSRYAYAGEDLHWRRRFADIFAQTAEGRWSIDLDKFHQTLPLET
ncbi:MAG: ATP-sensitive inward rectifier potassium channel 10 [Cyanobacteria bacterium RI_101]|nr:ATP-sensitive inward rectifier potassium channel 10 [Cyanobacteria bacterium RI_101]